MPISIALLSISNLEVCKPEVIPLASFYEKCGTYINKDGIKQKVISGMNKNFPELNASDLIQTIQSMLEKGNI